MKQALVRHAHKHTPGVQADRAAQTARGTAHGPVAHNLEARMGCRVERHWSPKHLPVVSVRHRAHTRVANLARR